MKPVWIVTAIVLVVSLALDVGFRHLAHAEFPWHTIPGFDFGYGVAGCAAIVIVSKWAGHTFLLRPEGYDEGETEDEGGPS